MPPGHRDLFDRIAAIENELASLRRRNHQRSLDPTFVREGAFTADASFPSKHISLNPYGDMPERKQLVGFRGIVEIASCVLKWQLNFVDIAGSDPHAIDYTPGSGDIALDPPVELQDGDWIRPVLVSAADAVQGLSACAIIIITAQA